LETAIAQDKVPFTQEEREKLEAARRKEAAEATAHGDCFDCGRRTSEFDELNARAMKIVREIEERKAAVRSRE
jgi:hypothetical protein